MSSFNQATLIGHLGNEPEVLKQSQNWAFVRLSVATNSRKALVNGDFVDDVQWHTVFVNGSTGKYVAEYLKKGDKVFAVGEIRTNSYQKNGQTLYSTAIYANVCQWLASKKPVEETVEKTTLATVAPEATPAPDSHSAVEEERFLIEEATSKITPAMAVNEATASPESNEALEAERIEKDAIPF